MQSKSTTPKKIAALYETAHTLHLNNHFLEAERLYKELLMLDANHAVALADLGTLYLQTNKPSEGEAYLKKSLSINPNQAFALNNLGTIFNNANKSEEADSYYAKAIELDPNYADAFNNLGLNQYGLRQFINAITYFSRALEINPHYFDAQYHLALCLVATKQFSEAEESFNKALTLSPSFARLNLNFGLMKLLLGDFETGLPLYEWRWHGDSTKNKTRQFNKPLWLGAESIAGKTILLHPEQGFGDFIQFCRYALDLDKMGANIILEVSKPLLPLVQSLSDKFTYITEGQTLPKFDFHCPIASLPMVLNTRLNTIPSYSRYLKTPTNKKQYWGKRLGKKTVPRIGIAWSGSATYKNDWKRSLPIHFLTTILRMDAEFHLLQKETKPRDWQILALNRVKSNLINHEVDLHDFGDTAALIDEMDLVIAVDTSVAHLAGALGKPVWLLIPYLPDFRWLLDRDDSPWYPSVKLFRQSEVNDWKETIAQLNDELAKWLKDPSVSPIKLIQPNTETTKNITSVSQIVTEPCSKAELNKAVELHHAGKTEKAEAAYKKILSHYPNDTSANNMLGTLYLQAGNLVDAEVLLNKALLLAPKNSFALCNLAVVYSETNRKKEAVRLCEQAIETNAHFPEAYNNLGSYLAQLEENERAAPYLKRAVELKPDYTDAHFNLGLVYYRLKQFQLAESAFNTTIALKPDHTGVYYNLGLLKLLQGDFDAGLPLYESRWQDKQAQENIRSFAESLWLGKESIKGKTILLHSEQGHGDFIQFCRYAFDVEKLGANIIIEAHALQIELAKTLSKKFIYVLKGNPLPAFDFHSPLVSLPLAFNTRLDSIPAKVPYLSAPQDKITLWQSKLGKKTLPRIGIVWSGTTGHLNDHNRSIPLNRLASLFSANAEFHVLQKEVRASDQGALKLLQAFNNVHIHQYDLHDFTDTAALINEMDLVISVDTSVAHLAGALARPLWVLLPFIPDFRWLLDREDSPWYPTAKLFRQTKSSDWNEVLNRVKHALEHFLLDAAPLANERNLYALPEQGQSNLRVKIDEALSLHAAGNLDEALQLFLAINKTAPDNTEALTILATIYMQLNNLLASQCYFEHSLSLDDKNVLTLHNYGLLLEKLNRYDEAVKFISAALALYPQYEDAYNNKIVLLKKIGQDDAVIETLLTATTFIKKSEHLYFQLHKHLHAAGRFEEALAAANQLIGLNGNLAEGYNSRGNSLLSLKRPHDALASYNQALTINPKHVHALSNASNAYLVLNQTEKALVSCEAALVIEPNLVSALNNRANALKQLKRFDEALQVCDEIVELDTNNNFVLFNKSLIYLLLGNFKAGWPLYEYRWQALPHQPIMKQLVSKPIWLGETSATDKVIFIHNEQGFGDAIQFCRYLPMVINKGFKQVYIIGQKSLQKLFLDSFKHDIKTRSAIVISDGDAIPQFDYQCPIMSLPLAFDTQIDSIPAKIPYLFANTTLISKWQFIIENHANKKITAKKINIGLVWAGSTIHTDDINRSITLAMLADVLALDVQFHSLQKEMTAEEEVIFNTHNVQSYHTHLTDFAETAALINEMDLIISVDTAVAHLAGALGKPVWILLPYLPDFRWLLDREDSPWYPTAKLFRQTKAGGWDELLKRVHQALKTEFKLS